MGFGVGDWISVGIYLSLCFFLFFWQLYRLSNIDDLFVSSGKEIVKKTVNIYGHSIIGFGANSFLSFGGDTTYQGVITYFVKTDNGYQSQNMEFNETVFIKEIDNKTKPRLERIFKDISHIPKFKDVSPRYIRSVFYVPKGTIIK